MQVCSRMVELCKLTDGGAYLNGQGKEAAMKSLGEQCQRGYTDVHEDRWEKSKLICGALHAQAVSYLHMLLIHNS